MGNTIKNKSSVTEKEEHYCLSQDEYDNMMEAFYHAESLVRIVRQLVFDHGENDQVSLDVSNCLTGVEDKLKVMISLLMK